MWHQSFFKTARQESDIIAITHKGLIISYRYVYHVLSLAGWTLYKRKISKGDARLFMVKHYMK